MAKSGDSSGRKLKALAAPDPQEDASSSKLPCRASSVILAQALWTLLTVVVSSQACQGCWEEE